MSQNECRNTNHDITTDFNQSHRMNNNGLLCLCYVARQKNCFCDIKGKTWCINSRGTF